MCKFGDCRSNQAGVILERDWVNWLTTFMWHHKKKKKNLCRQVKFALRSFFLSCWSLFAARQHERVRLLARRRVLGASVGDVREAGRTGAERTAGRYRPAGDPSAQSLSPVRLRTPDVRVQHYATRPYPGLPSRTGVQLSRKTVGMEMLCVSLYSVSTSAENNKKPENI